LLTTSYVRCKTQICTKSRQNFFTFIEIKIGRKKMSKNVGLNLSLAFFSLRRKKKSFFIKQKKSFWLFMVHFGQRGHKSVSLSLCSASTLLDVQSQSQLCKNSVSTTKDKQAGRVYQGTLQRNILEIENRILQFYAINVRPSLIFLCKFEDPNWRKWIMVEAMVKRKRLKSWFLSILARFVNSKSKCTVCWQISIGVISI
jgi:hypothetical protein